MLSLMANYSLNMEEIFFFSSWCKFLICESESVIGIENRGDHLLLSVSYRRHVSLKEGNTRRRCTEGHSGKKSNQKEAKREPEKCLKCVWHSNFPTRQREWRKTVLVLP